ncbi:hypothetical protein [Paenibacillus tianjinensis]|uniref:Uncharacterized protein n=1 Tax=Paenibacillus tianjinensis TaxID=2810347 RepID=A0ABX7LBZ9_9BACL|nr:hypothetical protein [Paenibacillus tianjinensis]QSF43517.1 hypothetical protein JRJ22_19840 [Paenibacillus tianjinensis]
MKLAKNRLLNSLNMVNSNYRECRQYIPSLSEYINIEQFDIFEFYRSADSTLKNNLERALNELQNKKNIFWSQIMMVSIQNIIRPARDGQEYENILRIQGEVLDEFNCEDMRGIIGTGKYDEYSKRVNERLNKEMGIQFIYEAYDIQLNRERLKRELVRMKGEERLMMEFELNQSIQERLTDNIQKRHNRALNKVDDFFSTMNKKEENRIDEQYVSDQIKLVDTLINSRHERIFPEIRKLNNENMLE